MLNQLVMVGRLTEDVEVQQIDDDKIVAFIKIAIPRSFKNQDGEYDTDIIECMLYNTIASNTAEYCKKGDLVGIKGRLENKEDKMIVVAEKITFLSSTKPNKENEIKENESEEN